MLKATPIGGSGHYWSTNGLWLKLRTKESLLDTVFSTYISTHTGSCLGSKRNRGSPAFAE